MTCREKLIQDHPIYDEYIIDIITQEDCPSDFDYHGPKVGCDVNDGNCWHCWNQEIIDEKEKENKSMTNTKKTKTQLIEELEAAQANVATLKKQVENLDRYKQYEEAADEIKAMHSAFMNSGFTNEQAFDLIKMMTNLVAHGALNNILR